MQTADNKPGNYYVTVRRDNGDYRFLAGPFLNNHQAALDMVEPARKMAESIDPRAHFYSFGTARLPLEETAPAGILNKQLEL